VARTHVDVDRCPASDFCLEDQLPAGTQTAWHAHTRHQLLYASAGTLTLQIKTAQWYLPPQRAAFIPANTPHQVNCTVNAELCTVYLATDNCPELPLGVFAVPPIAREMLLYARRWGYARAPDDIVAKSYFQTLGHLASEWVKQDTGLCLPIPASPELKRAIDYLLANLADGPNSQGNTSNPNTNNSSSRNSSNGNADGNLAAAASAARVSERTLSRRFKDETGTTLRQFIRTARVLRAMEQLAVRGTSITQVAFAVGFEDVTALSRAFKALLGELPSDYQKRVLRSAPRE